MKGVGELVVELADAFISPPQATPDRHKLGLWALGSGTFQPKVTPQQPAATGQGLDFACPFPCFSLP